MSGHTDHSMVSHTDVCSASTLLMCRCDSATCDFITSVIDPRDHPYILGATKDVEPLASAIASAVSTPEYQAIRKDWVDKAEVMTFDEAVQAVASPEQFSEYKSKVFEEVTPMSHRRKLAKFITGQDIFWDWELPRSADGQYMWKPTIQAVIERACAVSTLGDVTWARIDAPSKCSILSFLNISNENDSMARSCRVPYQSYSCVSQPIVWLWLCWWIQLCSCWILR